MDSGSELEMAGCHLSWFRHPKRWKESSGVGACLEGLHRRLFPNFLWIVRMCLHPGRSSADRGLAREWRAGSFLGRRDGCACPWREAVFWDVWDADQALVEKEVPEEWTRRRHRA